MIHPQHRGRRAAAGLLGASTAVGMLVGFAAPAGAAAAFCNGSFEVPNVAPASFQTVSGAAIPCWAITSGDVDVVRTTWVPQDGMNSIDLNGTAPGTLCQTFDTTVGLPYQVGFWMSRNYLLASPAPLTASITGGPSLTAIHTGPVSPSAPNWMFNTFTFTATAASSTLCFASGVPTGSFGPAIDNVTLNTPPTVPVSIVSPQVAGGAGVAALAAAGLFLLGRRRRADGALA